MIEAIIAVLGFWVLKKQKEAETELQQYQKALVMSPLPTTSKLQVERDVMFRSANIVSHPEVKRRSNLAVTK